MDKQVEVEHSSEDELRQLVGRFYAAVREDALIGPPFNAAVDDSLALGDDLSGRLFFRLPPKSSVAA